MTVNVDGTKLGRTFEGIGAVSAGASTRLLYDYPDSTRADILDFLFKPKFGAGFQHLKVEIGGGENSTCGSEPSHAITKAEVADPVPTRGYELWLAREARNRNPDVILDALAWSYPYWFSTTWSQDNADYMAAFLKAAKQGWDLDFQWLGACKNEKGYNRNWIVNNLRPTLDKAGFPQVKLHAAENLASDWKIADEVQADAGFSAALDAISVHYPSRADNRTPPSSARNWGKPLWANEEWSETGATWANTIKLARSINKLYPRDLITKHSIWCPIDAIYGPVTGAQATAEPIMYAEVGAMQADTPWSGHYTVWPAIWAVAHTTQFAEPGWNYVTGGCGRPSTASWDGSYVTLKNPATGDYSIIIVTGAATSYTFNLSGGLSTSAIRVWSTNASNAFMRGPDIAPSGGAFTIDCAANSIYSLTTTTGQSKGSRSIPPSGSFPFPYYDNYEGYAAGQTPKYHSDQKGTFEVAADADGKHLKQILPAEGILWHTLDKPVTVFGDMAWTNYDFRAKVFVNAGNVEMCARIGEVTKKRGYRFILSKNGGWQLMADASQLRSGTASGFNGSAWHTVKLSVSGSTIAVSLDGAQLVSLADATRRAGMAGFASSYNANMFDDLMVEPVGANGTIPTGIIGDVRTRGSVKGPAYWDGRVIRLPGEAGDRRLRTDGKTLEP